MSYIINQTDGNVLCTLLDGTTNTQTGLTLIGRNYIGYGREQNENFIRLLENFADGLPPGQSIGFQPIAGQLWWDTANSLLKIYNGAVFVPVSQRTTSATAPSAPNTGDQWWNSTTSQLFEWNGSTYVLIGPSFSASQGASGEFVETITDTGGGSHTVVSSYVGTHLISVMSADALFTPNVTLFPQYSTFTTIQLGQNLTSSAILNGTAANTNTIGNVGLSQLARTDAPTTFAQPVTFNSNINVGTSRISDGGGVLTMSNSGNVEIFAGNLLALHVDGSTQISSTYQAPITQYNIANKGYVDSTILSETALISSDVNQINGNLAAAVVDYNTKINGAITSLSANLSATQSSINSNVAAQYGILLSDVNQINANAAYIQSEINTINSTVATLAPLVSPHLSGVPTTPIVPTQATFLAGLPSSELPYTLTLSGIITAHVGDIIQFVDATTLVQLAVTLLVSSTQTINNQIVCTIANGTLQTGTQTESTFVKVNGAIVSPAVGLTYVQFNGPSLNYLGLGDNSNTLASTSYVDITANILHADYSSQISTLSSSIIPTLQSALLLKANINSPALTGTPTSITPMAGDNSNNIATTAFVTGAIQSGKFNYTVSTSPPTGGNAGDFWFQI